MRSAMGFTRRTTPLPGTSYTVGGIDGEQGSDQCWIVLQFPDTPILVVGDLDQPLDNPVRNSISAESCPIITAGAATLSIKDRHYANLYDNICVYSRVDLKIASAGIVQNHGRIHSINHETRAARCQTLLRS